MTVRLSVDVIHSVWDILVAVIRSVLLSVGLIITSLVHAVVLDRMVQLAVIVKWDLIGDLLFQEHHVMIIAYVMLIIQLYVHVMRI